MNKNKKLAVVVPMYNVEDYLTEAVNSILNQQLTEKELQIILIDDGSEDNTLKIANNFAKEYPGFIEVHSFQNGGLGTARNRGTRIANAEYIAYLDPDDLVAENSYSLMLDTIERTGSEIITGNVLRFNSKKTWTPDLHAKAILGTYEHTSLDEHPELIWDASSWNKLYRLGFLRKNNFYFPEGVLYEDFPMVNPAYAKANGIDVLKQVVYMWRVREGSITHQSTGIKATMDRIKVNQIALNGLKKYKASKEVIEELVLKGLNMGILAMLKKEKYALIPKEDRQILFNTLKSYLLGIKNEYFDKVSYKNFIFFKTAKNTISFEEWDKFALLYLRDGIQYKGEWIDNVYMLKNNITDAVRPAQDCDFKVNTKVTNAVYHNDNLVVKGWFFPEMSDMSSINLIDNAKINLLSEDNQYIVRDIGSVNFSFSHEITAKFGYNKTHFILDGADFNYDYSLFELSVPSEVFHQLKVLKNAKLELEAKVDGILVKGFIGNPLKRVTDIWPEPYVSENGTVLHIDYPRSDWQLRITYSEDEPVISLKDSDTFEICNSLGQVSLFSGDQELPLNVFGNQVKIPLKFQESFNNFDSTYRKKWQFITKNSSVQKPVYFFGEKQQFDNDVSFEVFNSERGLANLSITWIYPFISDLKILGNTLYLTIRLVGWQNEASSVQILADPNLPDIIWDTQKISNNEYQLVIPLTLDGFGDKKWLNIHAHLQFEDGYVTDELVRWGLFNSELLDASMEISGLTWKFAYLKKYAFGGFAIQRTANRLYREQTGAFESFLESSYSKWVHQPVLNNVVMWSAYWGRDNKFGGNPLALFNFVSENYPELQNVIVVQNKLRSFTEFKNAKVISFGTKEYWYYQARAKYFINDVNWTDRNRNKRPEQVEMETMHGTPLKAMGFDVLDEWKDTSYYSYLRRFNNYDYLVVPSEFVSNYAQHAFQVHPKILKTGYPRNDVFFKKYSDHEKKEMKQKYNLPVNKKIILYAPTWRNQDQKIPTNINKLFNIKNMYDSLNDDTIIVVKNHNFEKLTGIDKKYQSKIILADETASIESLYIISDAVITDYSSVMFDYALLNKPMIFWAFDYEEYVKNRGINFDLKADAPGPFVQDEKDLINWVNKFDQISSQYSDKIIAFKDKFGQYDVGTASRQIAEIIWGEKNFD
ncbi:bifunctional glycosyltransferase/CDP-glycerol:glycerophosphate glycerophosphotransferase [Weissella hellenica]|uniref:CDP-glycerol glycerophosphotransferase n=1 Tax=Weissella hellenica TaxID=46256 RepID=A0A4Y4G8U7_WEIHE|nr:CDP-glycerol glycerophosphotransferase family protein [Weissella hellenica]NKY67692.1 glycosyltransferase [Weissella hellenica]GED36640.1 glycosyl transferase family A [Weissella hellenica]SCC12191.1 CDP-glycerol glycerophosphotransferase [Weissella hellenica]